MEQATHSLSTRDQAVINFGRRLRLCDLHWNMPLFKQIKRLLTRAQHQQHSPTQNNRLTTVVEQFLNVRRLNSEVAPFLWTAKLDSISGSKPVI